MPDERTLPADVGGPFISDAGQLSDWTLSEPPRIHIRQLGPAQLPGPHIQRFLELVMIEAGEARQVVDVRNMRARPGDVFLVGPGQHHYLSALPGCLVWSVHFGADVLEPGRSDLDVFLALPDDLLLHAFLGSQGTDLQPLHVPESDRPRWLRRLTQLEAELREKPPAFAVAARSLLRLMLVDAARLVSPWLASHTPHVRPLLTRVFRFIEAHYSEPIDLAAVASEVGRSPAYLTDLVRRETGRTVHAWIVERRMARARSLLLETDHTVGHIAQLLGYADASHFIAQFRKLQGSTPQAWRQARR